MSKRAEEAALKAYPVKIFGYTIDCKQDWNEERRTCCQEGYELAEKDLALTWEDIKAIDELLTLVYEPDNEEEYYTRVLEEFKYRKREEK